MSLDKSLRTTAALTRHRNVLSRHERIEKLKEEDRWTEGQKPLGLPKIAHRKVNVGAKDKRSKAAEEKSPKGPRKRKRKNHSGPVSLGERICARRVA